MRSEQQLAFAKRFSDISKRKEKENGAITAVPASASCREEPCEQLGGGH